MCTRTERQMSWARESFVHHGQGGRAARYFGCAEAVSSVYSRFELQQRYVVGAAGTVGRGRAQCTKHVTAMLGKCHEMSKVAQSRFIVRNMLLLSNLGTRGGRSSVEQLRRYRQAQCLVVNTGKADRVPTQSGNRPLDSSLSGWCLRIFLKIVFRRGIRAVTGRVPVPTGPSSLVLAEPRQ